MICSVLFHGDDVLTAIAGGLDRMSTARNASVRPLQTALRNWDPHCLPAQDLAPTYCAETAAAVRRFKVTVLGEPEASATDVAGPEIVLHLDRLQATAESRGGAGEAVLRGAGRPQAETPAIHTNGTGRLTLTVNNDRPRSRSLVTANLSSPAQMAHVHFGQPNVAGGVSFFFCGGRRGCRWPRVCLSKRA